MSNQTIPLWGHDALGHVAGIVDDGTFLHYALRVLTVDTHDDATRAAPALNTILAPSRKWVDGEATPEFLPGASGVDVSRDWNTEHNAYRCSQPHLLRRARQLASYFGRYVVLIAGNTVEHGEDLDEMIIEDARVLAVFDRGEATCDWDTWGGIRACQGGERVMQTTITVPVDAYLDRGSHPADSGQQCVMELASRLAGEPWSDQPACVASTLRTIAIGLNDRMPDDVRQGLLAYVPRLVGTAPESAAVAQRRGYICADYAVRVFAPLALDAIGIPDHAAVLRALPPVTDRQSAIHADAAANAAAAAAGAAGAADAAADAAAYAAGAAGAAAYADAASAADAAAGAADAAADAAAYAAGAAAAIWDHAYDLLNTLLAITERDIA